MDRSRVEALGNYLRQRRLELGLSAREVGRLSGTNYQTVIRIENGEFNQPRPETIKPIAQALDMNLSSVWAIIGYFDTELPEPMIYLRAKYRDLPADELKALSDDVAFILTSHGLKPSSGPAPGEDEFDDDRPLQPSSPSKGGTS